MKSFRGKTLSTKGAFTVFRWPGGVDVEHYHSWFVSYRVIHWLVACMKRHDGFKLLLSNRTSLGHWFGDASSRFSARTTAEYHHFNGIYCQVVETDGSLFWNPSQSAVNVLHLVHRWRRFRFIKKILHNLLEYNVGPLIRFVKGGIPRTWHFSF